MTWYGLKNANDASHPAAVSRYFNNYGYKLMKCVLYSQDHYHFEFQQCGCHHMHDLLWVEDTSKYVRDGNEDVYAYNDKLISCSTDVSQDKLQCMLLQKHIHSKTCMKVSYGKKTCQFDAPWPPMCTAIILEPLDVDENAQHKMYVWLQSRINIFTRTWYIW